MIEHNFEIRLISFITQAHGDTLVAFNYPSTQTAASCPNHGYYFTHAALGAIATEIKSQSAVTSLRTVSGFISGTSVRRENLKL